MPWLIPVVMGIAGAAAGAEKDHTTVDSHTGSTTSIQLGDFADLQKGQSGLESDTYKGLQGGFKDFASLVGQGPGASAMTDATSASNQYADILKALMNNSGMPTQQQIGYGQQFAQDIFNPQRVALQQSFVDQNQQASRLQARLGRGGYDPILQNKLALGQTNAMAQLNAQQGALAAQTSQQMPGQQAQYGEALSNLRNNLAMQALQNRQTLMAMGQSIMGGERDYRIKTATQNQSGIGWQDTASGGGAKGMIGGLMKGVGSGMGMMGGMGN